MPSPLHRLACSHDKERLSTTAIVNGGKIASSLADQKRSDSAFACSIYHLTIS